MTFLYVFYCSIALGCGKTSEVERLLTPYDTVQECMVASMVELAKWFNEPDHLGFNFQGVKCGPKTEGL